MRYFTGTIENENSSGLAQETASFGSDKPLLSGFTLRFLQGDRHLKSLGVFYDSANVYTVYGDEEPDNRYAYFVAYAPDVEPLATFTLPEADEIATGRGRVNIALPEPLAGRIPVLHGFRFDYEHDDHHIDRIRIKFTEDELILDFNDKNDLDKFRYKISYGLYAPHLFIETGTFTKHGAKGVQRFKTSEEGRGTVISGFDLDFSRTDHHIQHISVYGGEPIHGTIEYSDGDGDDRFKCSIDWARLR